MALMEFLWHWWEYWIKKQFSVVSKQSKAHKTWTWQLDWAFEALGHKSGKAVLVQARKSIFHTSSSCSLSVQHSFKLRFHGASINHVACEGHHILLNFFGRFREGQWNENTSPSYSLDFLLVTSWVEDISAKRCHRFVGTLFQLVPMRVLLEETRPRYPHGERPMMWL